MMFTLRRCVNPQAHDELSNGDLHILKEVGAAVLSVECLEIDVSDVFTAAGAALGGTDPGDHAVNGREMGLALGAAVDAGSGEVAAVAHAHGGQRSC